MLRATIWGTFHSAFCESSRLWLHSAPCAAPFTMWARVLTVVRRLAGFFFYISAPDCWYCFVLSMHIFVVYLARSLEIWPETYLCRMHHAIAEIIMMKFSTAIFCSLSLSFSFSISFRFCIWKKKSTWASTMSAPNVGKYASSLMIEIEIVSKPAVIFLSHKNNVNRISVYFQFVNNIILEKRYYMNWSNRTNAGDRFECAEGCFERFQLIFCVALFRFACLIVIVSSCFFFAVCLPAPTTDTNEFAVGPKSEEI